MKVEEFLKIKKKNSSYFKGLLKRTLITIVIVLSVLILCNTNSKIKTLVKKYTYGTNYNFSKINALYKKYILNLNDKTKKTVEKVNGEKTLNYTKVEDFNDGALLTVDDNYNVKMLESGLVVYIGEKNGIENTIIVQQSNGIDVIYGYIENTDLKVYDYVEKGTIIGVANKKLYLAFQKDGEKIEYEPYIK